MTAPLTKSDHDLLVAAHGTVPEAAIAWQRWRDGIDWDGAIPGDAFPLLPTVRRTLLSHGVDDALFPRFLGIARQSWLRNQRRRARAVAWLTAWPVDDLLVLPPTVALFFDGTRVLHGDTLHLAIRPESAVSVVRHLFRTAEAVGPVHPPDRFVPGFVHGTGHLTVQVAELGTVTVTWRIDHWLGPQAETAWRDAALLEPGPPTLRALSPTDEVAFLLQHPVAGRPLRWAGDLLAADVAAVDWAALAALLDTRPLATEAALLLHDLSPLRTDWPLTTPTWRARLMSGPARLPATAPTAGRWRADWTRYRQAWGTQFRWPRAVLQLPGYALARWQEPSPRQLPRALWRWLRPQ